MSDTSYATYEHYGTAAQRAAFVPSPGGGQPIYIWYETDTGSVYLYHTAWVLISGAGTVDNRINDFRLTTESGVPVSLSDRTAQGTIYLTPFNGNRIALYTGSSWAVLTSAELSLALAVTSGLNYDVFVDYNGGTPQLVLGAAWTNDTTRAAAGAVVLQDGVSVLTANPDHRWVATIRASGSNVTADAAATRFVWNAYNQVRRFLSKSDATGHAYATATIRYWNADSTQIVGFVQGLSQLWNIHYRCDATPGVDARIASGGVGLDNGTAMSTANIKVSTAQRMLVGAGQISLPGIGYHFFSSVENAESAASVTFNQYSIQADSLM